jgi:NAD(P)-dependent dehydrogenase (short-subunit alcohol dehydrogenase family)
MSFRRWISENDSLEAAENVGSMAKWAGKTAIVTDATSGHGSAITSALAANQVRTTRIRVIALGTSNDEHKKFQRSIVGKNGVPKNCNLPVICDLAKEKEIVALPKIIESKWPECRIDILIHTASACSMPSNRSTSSNSMLMGSTSAMPRIEWLKL